MRCALGCRPTGRPSDRHSENAGSSPATPVASTLLNSRSVRYGDRRSDDPTRPPGSHEGPPIAAVLLAPGQTPRQLRDEGVSLGRFWGTAPPSPSNPTAYQRFRVSLDPPRHRRHRSPSGRPALAPAEHHAHERHRRHYADGRPARSRTSAWPAATSPLPRRYEKSPSPIAARCEGCPPKPTTSHQIGSKDRG